jgi:ATPase subunit of ABC transporter with duplicated ATPase domains
MSFGRLMLGRHNVLLMDEPTNHLDMESIESLQLALEKYPGTLMVISHDRQFVDSVANRVFVMKPGSPCLPDFNADGGVSWVVRLPAPIADGDSVA